MTVLFLSYKGVADFFLSEVNLSSLSHQCFTCNLALIGKQFWKRCLKTTMSLALSVVEKLF